MKKLTVESTICILSVSLKRNPLLVPSVRCLFTISGWFSKNFVSHIFLELFWLYSDCSIIRGISFLKSFAFTRKYMYVMPKNNVKNTKDPRSIFFVLLEGFLFSGVIGSFSSCCYLNKNRSEFQRLPKLKVLSNIFYYRFDLHQEIQNRMQL